MPAPYNFGPGNYKMGVEVAFPLLLRAERGKLQYTRIQVRETGLERQQCQRVIATQVNTGFNTLRAYERQLLHSTPCAHGVPAGDVPSPLHGMVACPLCRSSA